MRLSPRMTALRSTGHMVMWHASGRDKVVSAHDTMLRAGHITMRPVERSAVAIPGLSVESLDGECSGFSDLTILN